MADGGNSPGDAGRSRAAFGWLIGLSLAGVAICVGTFAGANLVLDRGDDDNGRCPDRPSETITTLSDEPISLEPGADQLLIDLKDHRGPGRDSTSLAAGSEVRGEVDVTTTALTGPDGTIEAGKLVATARGVRSTVLLDVCLTADALRRGDHGTYTGSIIVTDERLTPLTVPVTVTAQSRYVWGLAPLVAGLPLIAMIVAASRGLDQAPFAPRAWVAGIGAAGAVYGAQALSNSSWGGPVALFGLVASMYVASAGAIATVGPHVTNSTTRPTRRRRTRTSKPDGTNDTATVTHPAPTGPTTGEDVQEDAD